MAKKLPPAQTPNPDLDIVETTPPAIAAEQGVMLGAMQAYSEERDLVNQLLGQAQMAEASGDFFRTVRSSKLAYVKENKLYRALQGKKSPNGSEFLRGTWEEFCNLLGSSPDKVDLDIANLHAFGEQALESMSRMGIGYRELRQYRRLPADSQAALIEAAKAGDKDGLLDLAEELIARQAKEKAALAAEVEDARADIAAKDERAAKREREIDTLRKSLRMLPQRAPDETLRDMLGQLNFLALDVKQATQALHEGINTIVDHAGDNQLSAAEDIGTHVINAIRPLCELLYDLGVMKIHGPAELVLSQIGPARG